MRTLKQAVEDAYRPTQGGMSVGLPTCTVDASQLRALLLRVNAQQDHIKRLESLLKECADDLAERVDQEYPGRERYSDMMRRFERDMDCVYRARAALAEPTEEEG